MERKLSTGVLNNFKRYRLNCWTYWYGIRLDLTGSWEIFTVHNNHQNQLDQINEIFYIPKENCSLKLWKVSEIICFRGWWQSPLRKLLFDKEILRFINKSSYVLNNNSKKELTFRSKPAIFLTFLCKEFPIFSLWLFLPMAQYDTIFELHIK